ncbi:MAG TPA: sulfite exporter TauE/SafE family protein, partial [Thermoplasmata archaeon]|nr:sulfite exporter TauE/SafE family protein [Thermoplasmata archaeon]
MLRFVSDELMELAFGVFLIGVSIKVYLDLDKPDKAVSLGWWMLPVASVLAFASGLVSIALAVGGGLLLVPLFVYVMNVEARAAVGTASMVAAVNTIAGFALLFAYHGPETEFDFVAIPVIAAVALVGSFLGSRWGLKNLKTRTVYVLVIIVMVAAAAAMLAKGLGLM